MSVLDSLKSLGKIDFAELDLNNIGSWPAAVLLYWRWVILCT